MATNFGTKIVINAYKCISARANENAITYNRKFSWSDNPKKTFLIARSKRRCHGNHFFGQNRQKYHENGHNLSCMRHIHAEFGFDIWFLPSGNSPVTLLYTKNKRTLPWQAILDNNCYKCISTRDNESVITYNRELSWSAILKKTFLIGSKARCHGHQVLATMAKIG